jgi:glycosyltransferase involved in cell wall biosynthesis
MKIVQLFNRARSGFGGEETVIINTTAIMKQRGHQVIDAIRSSSGIGDSMPRKIAAAINGVYSFSAVSEMERLVEAERPDVVHAHNIYPQWSPSVLRACRKLGVPTVLHVHCHYMTCPNWYHMRNGQICQLCCGGKEYKCLTTNCRDSYTKSAAYFLRSYVARKFRLFVDNVNLFGSSSRPSSRRTRKRSRHLHTVAPLMRSLLATMPLLAPSSQPSTMRARMAMACEDFGRRAIIVSFCRSSSVPFSGLVGRPMAIRKYASGHRVNQRIYDSAR